MEFMEANPDQYSPFVEDDEPWADYVPRMKREREWGGQLEIVAASRLFQVRCVDVCGVARDGLGASGIIISSFHPHTIPTHTHAHTHHRSISSFISSTPRDWRCTPTTPSAPSICPTMGSVLVAEPELIESFNF